MTRSQIEVDADLIEALRQRPDAQTNASDSLLVNVALRAYLSRAALKSGADAQREADIDAQYAEAYTKHPLDEPDEWGSLAEFGQGAARARLG